MRPPRTGQPALTGLLAGRHFLAGYGERLEAIAARTGLVLEPIPVPEDATARVAAADVARIEIAFFSGDVFPERSPAFFAASLGAASLRWLHCFNAGTDHPIFARFVDRGVCLTSSPGASAGPIAQSAIAGLLALARGFPRFAAAQRERRWLEPAEVDAPPDLGSQTLVVLGLGAIGSEIARLGRALGLRVVGVRRSAPPDDAPIDEYVAPADLPDLLPRADWLAIACPLSDETRAWIDARALERLPRGAHLLNVARGEIVVESALCDALRDGRVAGAYLDVFEQEPLPESSPLWSHPQVIVTPHSAGVSQGNADRQAELFLDNLERYGQGEALVNVVANPLAG